MKKTALWMLRYYLVIGIVFSAEENIRALVTGKPTAFAWAGSLPHTLELLVLWFVWPAITWPYELHWMIHPR